MSELASGRLRTVPTRPATRPTVVASTDRCGESAGRAGNSREQGRRHDVPPRSPSWGRCSRAAPGRHGQRVGRAPRCWREPHRITRQNYAPERRATPLSQPPRTITSSLSRGSFGRCRGAGECHRSGGLAGGRRVGFRVWAVTSPKRRCSGSSRPRRRQSRPGVSCPDPTCHRAVTRWASATR